LILQSKTTLMFTKFRTILLLVACVAISNGCSTLLPLTEWSSVALELEHYRIDDVPFYPQEEYDCGPASLAMALAWSGIPVSPQTLAPILLSPKKKGTLQISMISGTRRFGRVAYLISEPKDLLAEVAAGHPVVVFQNLGLSWMPVWHYAVVVGYNLQDKELILHSGRIPANAKEERYIRAIVGLEKAAKWEPAIDGYKTALKKWPNNVSVRIGLGNTYYALGDLRSAEQILREASKMAPEEGIVFNNLAQVLWEQGRNEEASTHALKAVQIGGPLKTEFQRTLKEIQAGNER
jgi:tetratricopeptide (TPR) repeat protein